jgi:hypothetical protein
MKPTNNNGEIFTCNNCSNHAQPSATPTPRKKAFFQEYGSGQNYYFELTDSQIDLFDWLVKEDFLDGKFEVMADMDFVAP